MNQRITDDMLRRLKGRLLDGSMPNVDSRLILADALQELLELRSQLRDLRSQTLREARTVFDEIGDPNG